MSPARERPRAGARRAWPSGWGRAWVWAWAAVCGRAWVPRLPARERRSCARVTGAAGLGTAARAPTAGAALPCTVFRTLPPGGRTRCVRTPSRRGRRSAARGGADAGRSRHAPALRRPVRAPPGPGGHAGPGAGRGAARVPGRAVGAGAGGDVRRVRAGARPEETWVSGGGPPRPASSRAPTPRPPTPRPRNAAIQGKPSQRRSCGRLPPSGRVRT